MVETLDLREKGGVLNGERQLSDRRLFMQFLAFGDCFDTDALLRALEGGGMEAVLYADANDPRGVGVMTWSDHPDHFVNKVRPLVNGGPFQRLTPKPEYTMLGRTYAIGHEPKLEDWLLDKPRRNVLNPLNRWAVWYPLRRKGEFSGLEPAEQGPILSEHGKIGHSFGDAGLAADVRLACFGLDKNDNDFVIGLVGPELFPLSACIQAMRKTRQTSRYIEKMGPFFIGRVLWQSACAPKLLQ
ncbi:MAG TPA: chlorite dismutase family protein [Candidatus Xenobia bacterium]|jgi:chlorite dismutase